MNTPTCPACGSSMRLRSGSRGSFYGCSKYPSCRATRPAESSPATAPVLASDDAPEESSEVESASSKIELPRVTYAESTAAYGELLARLDDDQRAFVSWSPADGNCRCIASAGSGKTLSSVALIARLVREGVCNAGQIVATTFTSKAGKELAERLNRVLPPGALDRMRVGTFHGLALRALRGADASAWDMRRCLDISKRAPGIPSASKLWSMVLGYAGPQGLPGTGAEGLNLEEPDVRAYALAVDVARSHGWQEIELTEHLIETERDSGLPYLVKAWEMYLAVKIQICAWDFADALQAWHCVLEKSNATPGTVVIVDECFPARTPVLLADGTLRPIVDIVDAAGRNEPLPSVLSYNEVTRLQCSKQITGVKKVLLQKKTVRIVARPTGGQPNTGPDTAESWRRFGPRKLVCTEDHQIWTDRGWVEAKNIQVGDTLQFESSTPIDSKYNNKYKHSVAGRAALRASISERQGTMPRGLPSSGPRTRGGNGQGLTVPQQTLLCALGDGWEAEHIVPTGQRRTGGLPSHYKLDLANPTRSIAVEVDGETHRGVRAESDRRKDEFLRSRGWTVYRVSNTEAVQNALELALRFNEVGDCPVPAAVVSVETDYPISDYYVYDLEVEGTHCYYANGLLVHNCQDQSEIQLAIARLLARDGQLILVGDGKQAIYSWRGAYPELFATADKVIGATTREIRNNYRSGSSIVELGNRIAEGKEWNIGTPAKAARADVGSVTVAGYSDPGAEAREVASKIEALTHGGSDLSDIAILCRTNALSGAFEGALVAASVPCVVVGGQPFFKRYEVQNALAYITLSVRDDLDSLARIVNKPRRYLGAKFVASVAMQGPPGASILEKIDSSIRYLSSRQRDAARELHVFLASLRAAKWPEQADMVARLLAPPESTSGEADADRSGIVAAVASLARGFDSCSDFLDFAARCAGEVVEARAADGGFELPKGRVTISTCHRAKGLEWKHVFVSASSGTFPHSRATGARYEEECRLFYVACTRAKNTLTLTYSETDLYGRESGPSSFLSYVPGHEVEPNDYLMRSTKRVFSTRSIAECYHDIANGREGERFNDVAGCFGREPVGGVTAGWEFGRVLGNARIRAVGVTVEVPTPKAKPPRRRKKKEEG